MATPERMTQTFTRGPSVTKELCSRAAPLATPSSGGGSGCSVVLLILAAVVVGGGVLSAVFGMSAKAFGQAALPIVEPVLDIPYRRLAAAARVAVSGRSMIVYGTVLPWLTVAHHAPEVVAAGETSFDTFVRVLKEQVGDIEELRRHHGLPVVWAGDFNQVGADLGRVPGASAGTRPRTRPLGDGRMERQRPARDAGTLLGGPDLRPS